MQPDPVRSAAPTFAHYLTTDEVAARCGGGVTALTVIGWITAGIKTEAGVVRLSAVKLGGRWRVDPEAIGPFVAAVTAAALSPSAEHAKDPDPAPRPGTPAASRQRVAGCMAGLRSKGLGVLPRPRAK